MKTQRNLLKGIVIAIATAVAVPAGTYAAEPQSAETTGKAPAITLADKEHNFGYITEEGGPVTYEFRFRNTGDAPLVIISATASCGCTRPKYPTEPVKPGKEGVISVTYNPKNRPGEFDKAIKVRTNAPKNKKFTLKIRGTVAR